MTSSDAIETKINLFTTADCSSLIPWKILGSFECLSTTCEPNLTRSSHRKVCLLPSCPDGLTGNLWLIHPAGAQHGEAAFWDTITFCGQYKWIVMCNYLSYPSSDLPHGIFKRQILNKMATSRSGYSFTTFGKVSGALAIPVGIRVQRQWHHWESETTKRQKLRVVFRSSVIGIVPRT